MAATGQRLLCQFDTGCKPSLILDKCAKQLNLPVVRRETTYIRTLGGTKEMKTIIYRLQLRDTSKNIRTVKVKAVKDLGGNPRITGVLREKLARYFRIPLHMLADPTGELQLLMGQNHTSLGAVTQTRFEPPANSPEVAIVKSKLVDEYMLYGACGLDEEEAEPAEEAVKSAAELSRFIAAESDIKISNKCSDCEKIKCKKCNFESSQISIQQQAELEQILSEIEVVDNPEEKGKKMFVVQYPYSADVDPFTQFHRKDTNFHQVKKATLALRAKLEKIGKLTEFDACLKKEVERMPP